MKICPRCFKEHNSKTIYCEKCKKYGREYRKKYYQKNKGKEAIYRRQYYQKNKEKCHKQPI